MSTFMWCETVGWDSADRGGEVADARLAVGLGGDEREQPEAGGLRQRLEQGGESLGGREVHRPAAQRRAALLKAAEQVTRPVWHIH